jgi:hypothetical protein
MTILSTDFLTWTAADWQNFDTIRQTVYAPTPEQIAAQQAQVTANKIAYLTTKMAKYGIVYTGTETDFRQLYQNYVMDEPNMTAEFGSDLQSVVEYQYSIGNNLNAFYTFVYSQEGN